MALSIYLKNSSHRFYGAIVALVMLIFYEVFIVWGVTSDTMLRNAPELWLRTVLVYSGISHRNISFVMVTAALIAVPLFYKKDIVINKSIFSGMILESIFWGILSGVLIQLLIAQIFSRIFLMAGSLSGSLIRDLGLAIGAGLFEELFFRVILTTVLIWIGLKVIKVKWAATLAAIILASFLFSLAHYVGSASDSFVLYSFLFRFFAGLWFTTLYSLRGFAVVCMTHAFYDIYVIIF